MLVLNELPEARTELFRRAVEIVETRATGRDWQRQAARLAARRRKREDMELDSRRRKGEEIVSSR